MEGYNPITMPEGYEVMWISLIGSHMWDMEIPESDIDRIFIYRAPTRKILDGSSIKSNLTQHKYVFEGQEYDESGMEVGHLIHLLLKGNVNALWATMSPSSVDVLGFPATTHDELRDIVIENIAKNVYGSAHGMAISQYNDAMKEEAKFNQQKKMMTAKRTLNFAIKILRTGVIEFTPASKASKDDLDNMFYELELAYMESTLPEKPSEKPFRDWLYTVRWEGLDGMRTV